jgi:hypothetical protein
LASQREALALRNCNSILIFLDEFPAKLVIYNPVFKAQIMTNTEPSPDKLDEIQRLAGQLSADLPDEVKKQVTKELLNTLPKGADPKTAQTLIDTFLQPNNMLALASILTTFGNVSYTLKYAGEANKSTTTKDLVINSLHAVIFASFTTEKIVDLSVAAINKDPSRRELIQQGGNTALNTILNNYPLISGTWLTGNQVMSSLTFGSQASMNGNDKDMRTSVSRALAAMAVISMTLYKYKAMKEDDKPISPQLEAVMKPLEQCFGPLLEKMGNFTPYLAAALLTGPHISIAGNDLSKGKTIGQITPSLSTILGYVAYVAYLSSKNKAVPPDQESINNEADFTVKTQEHFSALVEEISKIPAGQKIDSTEMKRLLTENMKLSEPDAQTIINVLAKSVQKPGNALQLVQTIAEEFAKIHIDKRTNGGVLSKEQKIIAMTMFSQVLMEETQTPFATLEAKLVNVNVSISRRDLIAGLFNTPNQR